MGTQERTNTSERASGRTQAARCFSLPPLSIFPSFSRFRSVAARSLARPPSVSLALRRFCIFIDCHLTSPTTVDRGLRQFPHPSRVSLVPASFCSGSSSSIARYEEPLSLFLALFPRYHAPCLSFFCSHLSRSLVDPLCFIRSFVCPLSLTLSCRYLSSSLLALTLPAAPLVLLPPTLNTNSLDAAEFSFEATIRGLRYISTPTPLPPPLLPRLDVDVDLSASLYLDCG